jgi:isoaspartyl peptidase/L-asparaginase-like protein (Ntn-hydrolase superfamily)
VLSTWNHGLKANKYAVNILKKGGIALDAVVAGCVITEIDNG